MLKRLITDRLNKTIARVPAVALLGARQVGKTTLAKTIEQNRESLYLDLEDPEDLLKLSDPKSFLRAQKDRFVILDEIQRKPDLFTVLRGIIDENRQQGRNAGQFLLLGSASMELLRQSSESLAGRISYIEMQGFNILEAVTHRQDLIFAEDGFAFPNSYTPETGRIVYRTADTAMVSTKNKTETHCGCAGAFRIAILQPMMMRRWIG
jgi:predicted AAA+ superfamily ATPase